MSVLPERRVVCNGCGAKLTYRPTDSIGSFKYRCPSCRLVSIEHVPATLKRKLPRWLGVEFWSRVIRRLKLSLIGLGVILTCWCAFEFGFFQWVRSSWQHEGIVYSAVILVFGAIGLCLCIGLLSICIMNLWEAMRPDVLDLSRAVAESRLVKDLRREWRIRELEGSLKRSRREAYAKQLELIDSIPEYCPRCNAPLMLDPDSGEEATLGLICCQCEHKVAVNFDA